MKNKKLLIAIGAIALFAVLALMLALIPKTAGGDTPVPTDTNNTSVSAMIPSDTSSTDDPNISVGDPDVEGADTTDTPKEDTTDSPIVSMAPTVEDNIVVEDSTVEGITKEDESPSNEPSADTVIPEVKDDDTVQTGPASGEDRNDEIIADKEAHTTTNPPAETEKPVIVEDETVKTEEEEKGDVAVGGEDTNIDDNGKNTPEYKPSIGGDNPFDNDDETIIDDKPVEDYIGEGEDRPGEGIHF